MKAVEAFKRIRDACDEIIKAYENEDDNELQKALGKFMLLIIPFDSL